MRGAAQRLLGCNTNATCTNTLGSRTCACNAGFTGNGLTCADVNECLTNNGGCSANATCTNTPGSRTCACNAGYSGDGVTCADVNECLTGNGGCDVNATCANTVGSRTCTCNTGYAGTGLTCSDVNECLTNNGGCSTNATCTNTIGARTCACNAGYTGDGVTCTDINECLTNNGGCSVNATCANTPGSRTCTCNLGYTGSGLTCTWSDPSLSALTLSAGTLAFAPATTSYSVAEASGTTSVAVTATAPNPTGVTMTLNGATYTSGAAVTVTLSGPVTPVVVTVVAASGATRTYTVLLTRVLTQQAYVKAQLPGASDWFGASIALSADGNTMAVGACCEDSSATGVDGNAADNSALDSGAVFVFVRTGSTWTQQAYLKASNSGAGDLFGSALALSADGNTLVVGAMSEDSSATGINGNQTDNGAGQSGAAYVFVRSGASWSQQAYLKASNTGANDYFGGSLSLSDDGSTLAVGAYGEDSGSIQSNNTESEAGAVYVFTRSGTTWAQQAYVKYFSPFTGQYFGCAVSLSGDGSTLAAGSYGFSFGRGTASVFTRSGSTWTFLTSVLPFDFNDNDYFGASVSLSGDGTTLAVGAYGEDSNATGINGSTTNNSASASGAAYVYVRSGSSFVQQAFIKASNTAADDGFGTSVSLSRDGNFLAVGAFAEDSSAVGLNGTQSDNSATGSGAVYLFHRAGSTWAQNNYVKASNTGANDHFGAGVCVSDDGNTLAVGAEWDQSASTNQSDNSAHGAGAAYVLTP